MRPQPTPTASLNKSAASRAQTNEHNSGSFASIAQISSYNLSENQSIRTNAPHITLPIGVEPINSHLHALYAGASCANQTRPAPLLEESAEEPHAISPQSCFYPAAGDGACMFRAFLAAITKEQCWLSAQQVPAACIYQAIVANGWEPRLQSAILQALQLAKTDATNALSIDANATALGGLGLSYEQLNTLVVVLSELVDSNFNQDLYQETIASGQFTLWATSEVASAIECFFAGSEWEAYSGVFGEQFAAISEYLTNLIAQCCIEELDIPIDNRQPVHLQAQGAHYDLIAPTDYFAAPRAAPDDVLQTPLLPEPQTPAYIQKLGELLQGGQFTLHQNYVSQANDGSEFFRVLVAGMTRNPAWLSAKKCHAEQVLQALHLCQLNHECSLAIDDALLHLLGKNEHGQLQINGILFAGSENESASITQIISRLQNRRFGERVYQHSRNSSAFLLWDHATLKTIVLAQFTAHQAERLQRNLGDKFDELCEMLATSIKHAVMSRLTPAAASKTRINTDHNPVCLTASADFFTKDSTAPLLPLAGQPLAPDLLAKLHKLTPAASDLFVRTLKKRWGSQQQSSTNSEPERALDEDALNQAVANAADIFNQPIAASYDSFINKITGFDWQEETRNQSATPLVSWQQAFEAAGGIFGGAWNAYNHYLAGDAYNLHPKTNPGKGSFSQWFDSLTSHAYRYMAGEEQDSAEDLKLDETLAKTAEEILTKAQHRAKHKPFVSVNSQNAQQEHAAPLNQDESFSQQQTFNDAGNFDHSANQARLEAMNSTTSLPAHLLILPPSTKLNDPPKKKKKAPKIDPFMRRLRARWGAQMSAEAGLQIEKRAAAQLKKLIQDQEEQYQHANVTSKKSIRPLVKPGSAAWEKLTRQQKRSAKKEWESNQAVSQEVFGTDHEESRLQFIKKISGFDPEEEMRHFPHQELVSSQQAAEAAGSLLGSAWEKHNSLWSEAYDLNLQPKTNPGQKGFFDWFFMHYSQLFDSIAQKFAPFDADDWATMSDEKLDQFLAEEFLRFYAKNPTLFEDINENEKLIKQFQQFVQGLYTLLAPTSAAQKRAFSFDECASGVDGDNWSQQAACTSASMNTGAELFAASGITEAATPPHILGIKINLQEAAKEVTRDPDGSLDTESKQPHVSSGAFLFGGADAMPVNRLRDDAEVEQYKYQYAEWARAHAPHTRTKRRVNHKKKITPEMLIGLKFTQLNSQLSNKQLQGLQNVLNTPVKPDEDLSKRNAYLFQMLNKLSKGNQNVRVHVDDTLDALQMLLMERSETFRRSYTQYWYANEQSLKHEGDFFYHKAVEDFINPPGDMQRTGAAQKMVKSLRDKKDLILTEILNKQYQGEELDHRVLGMVFANLDINNFSNKGGSRAHDWAKTVIDWSNDLKASQSTLDKLQKHLSQEGVSSNLLKPYHLNQGAILDRAAGLAGANRGMCQYVATAALMALRDGDLDSLNNLHNTLDKLKKLYAQDVVSAYKVSAHLDEANKRMQDSYFFSKQKQTWESARNLATPMGSYEDTLRLITTSENGVRIVFQSEVNGKKAGHAVAVGRVTIDGEVVRVFIDVNMGIVPCYNNEQLIHAFTESLKAMPGYDANDPTQKFASFGALEMTKENIAIVESIQHDKSGWLRHGVLDVDKILSSTLTPQITKDPSWDGYIKNLDPASKTAAMDADFKVYKESVTHESFDVLLDRTHKARQKDLPVDIQKMPGGDLADYIHTSQAQRTKQQLLDSFVNQYHKNMMTAQQEPVRRGAKKIASDDTSNGRKLVIDTDSRAATDKKSLGSALLKALGGGSSAKKTVTINVDATGAATAVGVETPQAESQQKINLLLEKLNTYQSAVETMQQQNQASPAAKVLAGLLEGDAAKINKQQLDNIDLENQKIAQQLQDVQVRIGELIKAKGYSPDLFEVEKSIDFSNTNDITIRNKQNPLEKVTIPLNTNLSNSLKSIKKSITTRVTAFSNTLDDINPNIKSGAKNVWMASGKAMQIAGKVMAIYNMASLMKQVDSLPNMDKVAQAGFSIRMIDLAVDNIGVVA